MRESGLVDRVRTWGGGGVPFDERDLITLLVVTQLIDHPPRDHEPVAAGADAELLADVEMGDRIVVRGGVREMGGVEARPLVADDDLDAIVEESVADVDELLDAVAIS